MPSGGAAGTAPLLRVRLTPGAASQALARSGRRLWRRSRPSHNQRRGQGIRLRLPAKTRAGAAIRQPAQVRIGSSPPAHEEPDDDAGAVIAGRRAIARGIVHLHKSRSRFQLMCRVTIPLWVMAAKGSAYRPLPGCPHRSGAAVSTCTTRSMGPLRRRGAGRR
jgi:hypothetical protein